MGDTNKLNEAMLFGYCVIYKLKWSEKTSFILKNGKIQKEKRAAK